MRTPLSTLLSGVAFGCLVAFPALAEEITLTDIAGREVTLDAPMDRMILGEGR